MRARIVALLCRGHATDRGGLERVAAPALRRRVAVSAGLEALGAAPPRFGKDGADELIQTCAVRGDRDRLTRFGLFARERRTDVNQASLDTPVYRQTATQQRADAGVDFGIQLTRIGSSDLNTSELARASRGHVFAP